MLSIFTNVHYFIMQPEIYSTDDIIQSFYILYVLEFNNKRWWYASRHALKYDMQPALSNT